MRLNCLRAAGGSVFQGQAAPGILPKMLGPAQLDISAASGIGKSLPGVPAQGTPPLIDEFPGGQVGRVHRSCHDSPAGDAAVRPLRRRS